MAATIMIPVFGPAVLTVTERSREPAADLLLGGCATPIRPSNLRCRIRESHERAQYLAEFNKQVIIDNPQNFVEQHLPIKFQQKSSNIGLLSGCRSVLWNVGKHCHKWKRKISGKLKKRFVPDVRGINSSPDSMDTNTDLEMGEDIDTEMIPR